MSNRRHWWGTQRDVLAAAASVVAAWAFLLGPWPRVAVLDTLVAFAFLFVVPGYALLAALVPDPAAAGREGWSLALSGFERAAFSVVGSVALVIAVGTALVASPIGLTRTSVTVAVGGLALALTAVAAGRRRGATAWAATDDAVADERGNASARGAVGSTAGAVRDAFARDRTFVAALAALCLLSVVAIAGVAVVDAERFTEASLQPAAGNATADGAGALPSEVETGEAAAVSLRVANHEGTARTYHVVVQLQRVDGDGVVERRWERDRFTLAVPAGEVRTRRSAVTPDRSGEFRVQYLVYQSDPPADPTGERAAHVLQYWLSVEGSS